MSARESRKTAVGSVPPSTTMWARSCNAVGQAPHRSLLPPHEAGAGSGAYESNNEHWVTGLCPTRRRGSHVCDIAVVHTVSAVIAVSACSPRLRPLDFRVRQRRSRVVGHRQPCGHHAGSPGDTVPCGRVGMHVHVHTCMGGYTRRSRSSANAQHKEQHQ